MPGDAGIGHVGGGPLQTFTFGRLSGLRVSEYALGTGMFGGPGVSAAESRRLVERFMEAGGTFLDTASSYMAGESEDILGDVMAGRRDELVVATKYGRGSDADPRLVNEGNGRRAMVMSVERSLQRLRTDRIDLLWAHYDDGVTPLAEVVHAFDDLVRAGKVLHAGLSNFAAWRVARAQATAELQGLTPVSGIQVEHSLIERGAETELIPMAEAVGHGVALYSPLGGGLLNARHRQGHGNRGVVVHLEDSEHRTRVIDEVVAVAAEVGATPAQVAVAWQRARAAASATSMVSVIGVRTLDHLDGYLEALDVHLDDGQVGRLTAVSEVYRGAPHDGIGGPPDLGDNARLARNPLPPA